MVWALGTLQPAFTTWALPPPPPGQESEGEEAEQSRVELPAEAGARPGARQSRVRLYEVRGWWWCRWWWCGAALGGV